MRLIKFKGTLLSQSQSTLLLFPFFLLFIHQSLFLLPSPVSSLPIATPLPASHGNHPALRIATNPLNAVAIIDQKSPTSSQSRDRSHPYDALYRTPHTLLHNNGGYVPRPRFYEIDDKNLTPEEIRTKFELKFGNGEDENSENEQEEEEKSPVEKLQDEENAKKEIDQMKLRLTDLSPTVHHEWTERGPLLTHAVSLDDLKRNSQMEEDQTKAGKIQQPRPDHVLISAPDEDGDDKADEQEQRSQNPHQEEENGDQKFLALQARLLSAFNARLHMSQSGEDGFQWNPWDPLAYTLRTPNQDVLDTAQRAVKENQKEKETAIEQEKENVWDVTKQLKEDYEAMIRAMDEEEFRKHVEGILEMMGIGDGEEREMREKKDQGDKKQKKDDDTGGESESNVSVSSRPLWRRLYDMNKRMKDRDFQQERVSKDLIFGIERPRQEAIRSQGKIGFGIAPKPIKEVLTDEMVKSREDDYQVLRDVFPEMRVQESFTV